MKAVFYSSRSLSFPEPQETEGQVTSTPQEGVVPGLDFCNHREFSSAKWTVFGSPGLKVPAQSLTFTVYCGGPVLSVLLCCPAEFAW